MTTLLIRGARVMSCNDAIGDLDRADVLVEGTKVREVGQGLEAAGAEVVDAAGMLAIPGMVDTHTHLWETLFRGRVSEAWGMEYFTNIPPLGSWMSPEDLYAATYAGAVELLAAGVTTVFDYCHSILSPEHADAGIEALRDAGIRAIFGYDLVGRDPAGNGVLGPSEERFDDVARLHDAIGAAPGSDLQLAVCLSGVGVDTLDTVAREVAFGRELGCLMSYHNNTGGEIVLLDRADLLDTDILAAHGNYATDEDLELLGAIGGFLSTQTEAETYAGRRSMSMVARGHRRGVGIALGVDVPALVNPAIVTQMRLLYFLQRFMDGMQERMEGQVPVARRPGVPTLTVRDIFRFGTTNGQAALRQGEHVGQIAPGFEADIVLIDARTFGMAEGDPAAHVVLNSGIGDVDSVLVGGRFRKRAGQLVGVEASEMVEARENARRRVLEAAGEDAGPRRTHWKWAG